MTGVGIQLAPLGRLSWQVVRLGGQNVARLPNAPAQDRRADPRNTPAAARMKRPAGPAILTTMNATNRHDLPAAAQAALPDLVDLRRRLHRIPEVGLQLPATQAVVAEQLRALGLVLQRRWRVAGMLSEPASSVARSCRRLAAALLLKPGERGTGSPGLEREHNLKQRSHFGHRRRGSFFPPTHAGRP
jgi:hypothetical protein